MNHRLWLNVLLALAIMTLPGYAQEDQEDAAEVAKVEVGAAAPNFTVWTDEEKVVELKEYLAENNVVLVFVRAHW